MVKITLSLWDVGGQERFEFFKTDFFHGCASVGLIFDLTRPDSFDKVDEYFEEIRERSGNIPIVLVGNKNDLKEDIGETIPREKIIQKVNQHNLFEYIETSALKDVNVDKLFYRLAITALLDFRPRLGEIINNNHFRFKVVLVGVAAVGKSSLIKKFARLTIEQDYKLTVGLDLVTKDIEIPSEDLPREVLKRIKAARPLLKQELSAEVSDNVSSASETPLNKNFLKKHGYLIVLLAIIIIVVNVLLFIFILG